MDIIYIKNMLCEIHTQSREKFEKINQFWKAHKKAKKAGFIRVILRRAIRFKVNGLKEFPKWRNCYDYFKKWSKKPDKDRESVLEVVLKKISWVSTMVKTSFCIIDAQSVKNTDTAEVMMQVKEFLGLNAMLQ